MFPNDLRLRWYVSQDLPTIVKLENLTTHPWTAEQFTSKLTHNQTGVILLSQPGYTAGYILFSFIDYWTNERSRLPSTTVHIRRLVVDQHFRRRRVGSWLVEAAERHMIRTTTKQPTLAEQSGVLLTRAAVSEDLLDCHLFLRKIGFRARLRHVETNDEYFFSRMSSWNFSAWGTRITPLKQVDLNTPLSAAGGVVSHESGND